MPRQHNTPYLIKDGGAFPLKSSDKSFDEAWLRDFIFASQQALPVDEIEAIFGPLIPVCTELRTKAGPADILFINDAGLLTLVECKLWRNPEARREVIGQILDYAKELSRWNYEDLQRAVYDRTGKRLFNLVADSSEDLDESTFVDNVSRNLKRGRFLLLVVGDGIRESVELMADFLQQHAHLNFSFALVEISVFHLPEKLGEGYLVHPRLVTRTVEIERAVIRIEDTKIVAEMPTEMQTIKRSLTTTTRRTTISEQAFYESLATDAATARALRLFLDKARSSDSALQVEAGKGSLMLKFSTTDKEFNLGTFKQNGIFRNYGIAKTSEEIGHPEIGESYLEQLASLFEGGYVEKPAGKPFRWTVKKAGNQYVTIAECLAFQDRWLEMIRETIDKLLVAQDE